MFAGARPAPHSLKIDIDFFSLVFINRLHQMSARFFVAGLPNKHEAFTQCLLNVGPASQMVVQYYLSIG